MTQLFKTTEIMSLIIHEHYYFLNFILSTLSIGPRFQVMPSSTVKDNHFSKTDFQDMTNTHWNTLQ